MKHDAYLVRRWSLNTGLLTVMTSQECTIRESVLFVRKCLQIGQPSMNMLTKYRTPAYIEYTKRNYAARRDLVETLHLPVKITDDMERDPGIVYFPDAPIPVHQPLSPAPSSGFCHLSTNRRMASFKRGSKV